MGMVVRTNTMALNAYRQLGMNNNAVAKSLEKLASGYRINRAGDDAAGLAISEKMKAQITGLETASANAQDGISLIQTAEGNLSEVHDMLNRMVELATKSANGTYTSTERDALQAEVDQLLEEIDRISQSANFNGAKLLDGSLSATGGATKIEIGGNVTSKKSSAAEAVYHTNAAIPDLSSVKEDGTVDFTVAMSNGKSYNVSFTFEKDEAGDITKMIAKDGTSYTITQDDPTGEEMATAIAAELGKTELGKLYQISANQHYKADGTVETAKGQFLFKALEKGTDVPAITAVDFNTDHKNVNKLDDDLDAGSAKYPKINVALAAEPRDDGYEIDADSITEYDGTNYDDAVFTINGHKFVVLTNTTDTRDTGTANDEYLRAVQGLGSDVTILVGGRGGLKTAADGTPATTTKPVNGGDAATDAANNNFNQNLKKIAEVTGLNATNALGSATTLMDGNTIYTGGGIRLSPGEGVKGGLVLQIGDTADEYNKMRVSVDDMSAKGLGIKDLDITTEANASAAIDKIKNAINTVSSTRAGLGALQNRLEHTINNLDVAAENLSSANSRIRDTDMAKEMMNYTKMNVLVQSAQAMLAQANQQPQSVLQLLQ